jgi:hypothetical protein
MASRTIDQTNLPYKSYTDITSDASNMVLGSQNILTTSQQLMERRPGFSDPVEASPTTFTAVSRSYWWSIWGGTRFLHIVNDIAGGQSKVYKLENGVDANYIPIFTSSSASPFDFVVSNNTLFMGNGTDMRAYSGTGSSTYKWGITKPAALVSVGTTGTGISALAGGWFYRVTYWDANTSHESSSSDLSPCTGNVSNVGVTLPLVASAEPRVTHIRVYRTTDGGSTDPTEMQEITGSPFTNATGNVTDTTPDSSLSIRTAPGTTTNDPPTPCAKLIVYGGRIWGSALATTYFSAYEELTSGGVPEECWPSGLTGNNYPWPQEVTAQAPLADGIAVFTPLKIWKVEGTQRNNFARLPLLERRGCRNHTAVAALGNSVGWLDTSSQVWLDGQEVGFDIRNDIKSIDHSQAYLVPHIQGRFNWLCLLDGANNKVYVMDMDQQEWLPPFVLASGSKASGLTSAEHSSGNVVLTIALNKQQTYSLNPASYNDAGLAYSPVCVVNLLKLGQDNKEGVLDGINVETDSNIPSKVAYLLDDDPTVAGATFTDITANKADPTQRNQGVNLVEKYYKTTSSPSAKRACAQITWPTANTNFTCYTITIGPHILGQARSGE